MKRILTILKEKWPKYIFEILVLIIGIYGAFALESWNENITQSNRSKDLLRALKQEYTNNLTQLKFIIESHESVKESTVSLLRIIKSKPEVSEDSLSKHIAAIGFCPPSILKVVRSTLLSPLETSIILKMTRSCKLFFNGPIW